MPIKKVPSEEAFFGGNRLRRWPSHEFQTTRLSPIARPAIDTPYRLSESDRFFCCGSCFARNLEVELNARNLDVITADPKLGQSQNKYNVFSILNELRWALDENGLEESAKSILPFNSSTFHDTQGGNALLNDEGEWVDGLTSESAVMERRAYLHERYKRFPECSVFVFTLGMAEAWYDVEFSRYLNVAPSPYAIKKTPERFELHVLSYEEISKGLEEIYQLIRQEKNGESFRILISTSPVPLYSTFSGRDVLIANTYSKSVQRAASEAFAFAHEEVDYIPSYEMATLSERKYVWQEDQRHVSGDFVDFIISSVVAAMSDTDDGLDDFLSEAKLFFDVGSGNGQAAVPHWEKIRKTFKRNEELKVLLDYYKKRAG